MLPEPEFLLRHDRPGPRYTSYPTSPHWSDAPPEGLLTEVLPTLDGDASVYVHVPFCKEQCLYCGCHMAVSGLQAAGDRFLDALEAQLEAWPRPGDGARMARLHLGGGTPTWLTPAQLDRLFDLVERWMPPSETPVYSVEADPEATTRAHLETLAGRGVQRISFGVQSFDPRVLDAVQRPQGEARVRELVGWARELGLAVNLDLMYGLPHQAPEGWGRTLSTVLELRPDRLAVFGYAHVPWLKSHQSKLDEAALPDVHGRLDLLLQAHRTLLDAGYEPIGFDHFALPDDPMAVAERAGTLHRDFMGYTDRPPMPMIGLGPSAISQLDDRFAQQEPRLGAWLRAARRGEEAVSRGLRLTDDDRLRRDAILALTCRGVIDLDALGEAHGVDARRALHDALVDLVPLQEEGLVDVGGGRVRVTERGRLLVRPVAMAFDARMKAKREAGRYSRVI